MRNLFLTSDFIGTETGGGVVTHNESTALKGISDEYNELDAKNIHPPTFKIPDSPYAQDYIADAIILQMLNKKIDLTHMYSGMFAKTTMRLKAAGCKITQTIAAHDILLSSEEFTKLGLQYDFPHLTNRTLWLTYIEGQLLCDKIICPSKVSAETVKKYGVINPIVIPHGVTLPKETTPIPENFDVGYLGQSGPDKGLRYLLEAWSKLNLKGNKLLMAGRNIDVVSQIWNLVGKCGEVQFLGFVPDISELYNSISVYVQPSVTEGFGIEVLEAMAYGRPVIVSDGAGAADVVTEGVDGFVVPKRNVDAIIERITQLKNDPALVRTMGEKAKEKAAQYTWKKIIPQYQDLWRTL